MSKNKTRPANEPGTPTAGPWAFTEGDRENRDMSTIHKVGDKDFLIAYAICEPVNRHQRAEDIANARLMAAAPELLAASETFLETWNDSAGGTNDDEIAAMRAAVAKAKGGVS